MADDQELTNLGQLLDKIEETIDQNDDDEISLERILDVVGRRSFGPLLLLTGIIPIAPIPGIPTITGIIIFLISVQLLFRKKYFWLPDWLLRRSIDPDKLSKGPSWLRRPAGFIDKIIKPRLTSLSTGPATYAIALACVFLAMAMPFMELVPFSAVGGGAAVAIFGLSLITRDGLLALIAFIFTGLTAAFVINNLL